MLNELEHLLVCLGEEGSEINQEAAKALRFGLYDFKPGQPDTNIRRIEREVGQLLTVFERLGFKIHQEDKDEKNAKLDKYMEYSRRLGTLEMKLKVQGWCPRCRSSVPPGWYQCNGNGSHERVEESPGVFCLDCRRVMVDGVCPKCGGK